MKTHAIPLLMLTLLILNCQKGMGQVNIIPEPNKMEIGINKARFVVSNPTSLHFEEVSAKSKRQFTDFLIGAGFNISSEKNAGQKIQLQVVKQLQGISSSEGYRLNVSDTQITLTATTETGLFYGIQSLLQLVDAENTLPTLSIVDSPRFAYRGMHLDVSRHFVSVDFIKKQLDMMAHLKLNKFHWHLTDGAGWRLQIKKYPLLTQIAAWRPQETWKEWWATNPRQYVDVRTGQKAYGGFYTQHEAREIIKYAAERHITVIPEIEMPGHSEEVLAVYPHLSCAGKPYEQSEFCIGNELTFTFLQNVLKEVMKIFPSEYIHIGGDEADKSHWKKCPKCQARMKKEGLKNEDELQSYLIRRIEKFLIKNKRKLIGWDEILEGGLAPEATVMSWRGEEGGIKAAKSGHDVIMTPGGYMYFDSYQTNPINAPEAIGGYLPLEKVYAYNPVPSQLTAAEAKHIWGVQSNLWTEYVPTESHVEYMLYPRLLALSELAWTEPRNKHWKDFKRRVNLKIPYLQSKGINTFTLSDEPIFIHRLDSLNKRIVVELDTEKHGMDIRYAIGNSAPALHSPVYEKPLIVSDSLVITAQLFDKNKPVGNPLTERFDYHRAIGKKVTYNIPINKSYPAAGEHTLVDGECGGFTHTDGRWQGFVTEGMDVTIDMEKNTPLRHIATRFMQSIGPWIYFPKEVIISISNDNKNYTELTRIPAPQNVKTEGTLLHAFGWSGNIKGRYIRLQAIPNGIVGGWVFLDEITVW